MGKSRNEKERRVSAADANAAAEDWLPGRHPGCDGRHWDAKTEAQHRFYAVRESGWRGAVHYQSGTAMEDDEVRERTARWLAGGAW